MVSSLGKNKVNKTRCFAKFKPLVIADDLRADLHECYGDHLSTLPALLHQLSRVTN